jgi:hypothetical protein
MLDHFKSMEEKDNLFKSKQALLMMNLCTRINYWYLFANIFTNIQTMVIKNANLKVRLVCVKKEAFGQLNSITCK